MSNYYNRQWRLPNNENKDKQSNYSMDFDGSSQHIDLGDDDAFSFGNGTTDSAFSVSAWAYIDNLSNFSVLTKGVYNSTGEWHFRMTGANQMHLVLYDGAGYRACIINETLSINQWYHFAFTYDGRGGTSANDGIIGYLNGNLATLNRVGGGNYTAMTNSTASLYIARNGSNYSNGKIDAVAIYNYALSSSQVTTLYGSSSTGIGNPMSLSPKPVFYAPLGDQDSFNGSNYLVPNSSLKDYVFDTNGNSAKYFNLPKSTVGSDDFTFSFWVKPKSYAGSTSGNTLLGNSNGTPSANQWNMWIYGVDGKIRLVWYNQTNSAGNFMVTDFSFGAGTVNQEWVQVVLTRVGTTVTFYFNGVVDTATAGTLSSSSITLDDSSNATMRLPSPWGGALYNQDGFYSNLLWHNVGLSASEVATLYNNGSPIQTLSSIPQSSNVQGWWKLDASATYDGSNWTIPDDSSNSNDGTSSGMTQANLVQSDLSFTSGYSPYALSFDGTNDYIDVSADSSLVLGSGDFTISFWIKTADNTANILNPISSQGTGFFGLMIYQSKLRWNDQYNVSNLWEINNYQIVENTWINVVVIRNSGTFSVFYNNVPQTLTATSDSQNYSGNNGYRIGSGNLGDLDGSLSNFSIWNAALTSSQVTEIYNEGVPQNLNNHSAYSNLVSWWQLGSNSSFNTNWTVLDEKGSNNGTSANMTEDDIVDGVGSYANGTSSGMGGDEVIGDAPYSTANALSVNMDIEDRVEDTPS